MTQQTALAVRPQLTPDVWQMIQTVAPVIKASRLFGVASDEQAAAVMLKGYELGLSLTASFEFVHVIDGKPGLAPRGALALILNSPLCEAVEIENETDAKGAPVGCRVMMKRKGGLTYTARYTLEDAKRAGLVKPNSGWEKYPAQMCQWRAVGFAADVVFPDVLNGMKRADEFGADLTPDGDVIEGSWQPAGSVSMGSVNLTAARSNGTSGPQSPASAAVSQPGVLTSDPSMRLRAMVDKYGAVAIMEANSGRIPGTNDELDQVEATLTASNGDSDDSAK